MGSEESKLYVYRNEKRVKSIRENEYNKKQDCKKLRQIKRI